MKRIKLVSATRLSVEVDVFLNIIIKGLCKNGEINVARQVFDEFPNQG